MIRILGFTFRVVFVFPGDGWWRAVRLRARTWAWSASLFFLVVGRPGGLFPILLFEHLRRSG